MKKLLCLLICSAFCLSAILADSKSNKLTKPIKTQLNEIKNKLAKTEALKKAMADLQDEIKSSNVLDESTVKAFEEANLLMGDATSQIKDANIAMLKADLNDPKENAGEVKIAFELIENANAKLYKVQSLLSIITNKAQLIERIAQLAQQAEALNKVVVAQIEKELSGAKRNSEINSEVSESQTKLTKKLIKLDQDIVVLANKSIDVTEKTLLIKVSNIFLEDKIAIKSKEIEAKFEGKDLFAADLSQKEIITSLKKALHILSPEKEIAKEDNNPENVLPGLQTKISTHIQVVENDFDTSIGKTDFTSDPKYNDSIDTQKEINKEVGEKINSLPLDPNAKKELDKALSTLKRANDELENGEPQKAIKSNKEASQLIEKAIKAQQAANNEKPNKNALANQKPSIEVAGVNLEPLSEDGKAKQFANDLSKVIVRDNLVRLGKDPENKELWLQNDGEKNKAVLMQSLAILSPKEYAEPTKKYFEVISSIGE